LKFEADNTEIIYRTNESGTNRKTFTVSVWFKRTELGATQEVWHGGRNGELVGIGMITYSGFADQLWVDIGGGTGNTGTLYRSASNQVIRDTSAWYHFVLAVDTTQATEANRMKVWLNGVEVTSWEQHEIPVQDYQSALESGADMAWGGFRPNNTELFSGYLAECHYLDGVTAVQTDFGEYDEDSGIWKPKAYAGTYGDNGCYLNFDDSASLGADSSGNGNDFTLNNIAAADQATDTSTNNFCTLNVLNNEYLTITEGATKSVEDTNSAWYGCTTTIGVNNGKWYSEGKAIAIGTGIFFGVTPFNGTADASIGTGSSVFPGNVADTIGYWDGGGGQVYRDNSVVTTIGAFVANDIIGIALDMDNGYVYFAKNGTWLNSGDPTSGATGTGGFSLLNPTETHGFAYGVRNSTAGINFGGYTINAISSAASDENGYGTFEYAPPSGYYAICTKNLAEFG
jgi:hypothetical protein